MYLITIIYYNYYYNYYILLYTITIIYITIIYKIISEITGLGLECGVFFRGDFFLEPVKGVLKLVTPTIFETY